MKIYLYISLFPSLAFKLYLIPYRSLYLLRLFLPSLFPPSSRLMKCVEESGVAPFLLNQKMERLFWLLSPLAPEVLAPVSCTQISYSKNYCTWRTSLKGFFFPIPGRDRSSSPALESILLLISCGYPLETGLWLVSDLDPYFKKYWPEIMIILSVKIRGLKGPCGIPFFMCTCLDCIQLWVIIGRWLSLPVAYLLTRCF